MDVSTRLVFASVGTDHHRFDRLVEWIDCWFGSSAPSEVRCVVQYGTSSPPKVAEGHRYVPYQEMLSILDAASAVVSHGGPATIMGVRASGMRPIVVPRRPDLGEHVDGHQLAFSRRLADTGDIALAETEEEFVAYLQDALQRPDNWVVRDTTEAAETVRRFAAMVDNLVDARSRRRGIVPRWRARLWSFTALRAAVGLPPV